MLLLPEIYALLWSIPMDKLLKNYMRKEDQQIDDGDDRWYMELVSDNEERGL